MSAITPEWSDSALLELLEDAYGACSREGPTRPPNVEARGVSPPRGASRNGSAPLAALALALGAACAGPGLSQRELQASLASCPRALEEEALLDVSLYERCRLPAALAASVRNDFADDELEAPDHQSLESFAGLVPRDALEYQLRTFVNPDGSLWGWFALEDEALWPDPLFAPRRRVALAPARGRPPERHAGTLQPPVEERVPFRAERQAELRAAAVPGRPLAGVRVLIDPGHFGGRWAGFEHRRFTWAEGTAAGLPPLQEGDLTLRTARELAAKLEARGAEVRLTRTSLEPEDGPPLASLRRFADALLRHLALDTRYAQARSALPPEDRAALDVAAALYAVRKQFIFETLRARVRRAADFAPDVTLSLHFNAGPWKGARRADQALVAMVRGNLEAARAYNPAYRVRALREALAIDEFNASAHLAALCLAGMSQALDLPHAQRHRYEDQVPIRTADGEVSGVGAWNGVVLRYASGPAVLLEGPSMNEQSEALRLLEALGAPPGQAGTRTEQYARGVAWGLEQWVDRWLAQTKNDFGPEGLGRRRSD